MRECAARYSVVTLQFTTERRRLAGLESGDEQGRRLTPQRDPRNWLNAEGFRGPRSSHFRRKPSSQQERTAATERRFRTCSTFWALAVIGSFLCWVL
jgi:hypothetical protein